jgi:hypothetical protein
MLHSLMLFIQQLLKMEHKGHGNAWQLQQRFYGQGIVI